MSNVPVPVPADPTTDPTTVTGFTSILDELIDTLWPGTSVQTVTTISGAVVGLAGMVLGWVNPSGSFSGNEKTAVVVAGLVMTVVMAVVHQLSTAKVRTATVAAAIDAASLHLNYKSQIRYQNLALHPTLGVAPGGVPVVPPLGTDLVPPAGPGEPVS